MFRTQLSLKTTRAIHICFIKSARPNGLEKILRIASNNDKKNEIYSNICGEGEAPVNNAVH